MISWPEWRDSILEEKTVETDDGFKTGDGIKNAERILKKFRKKGFARPATPEEIKKIKKRDERRKKK